MKLDELLTRLDSEINSYKNILSDLEKKRTKISDLHESNPNAFWHNGTFCFSDIWEKITCMKIEHRQQFRLRQTDLIAKFSMGQKHRLDGRKIYSHPYENKIASVMWEPMNHPKSTPWQNKMKVEDIGLLIPDTCKRKKNFINRIKYFLVNEVHNYNLLLDDDAYNNEISKLLMLR